MSLFYIIGIGVGLSMDAFAVAVACSISLKKVSPRQVFRFGFHFGLFQAMMPVIGWFLGRAAFNIIAGWDHYVAFGLLAAIGGKSIYSAIWDMKDKTANGDPTRGMSLVVFSIATSIDALAIGLSLGVLEIPIWLPTVIIGLITAALTSLGMLLGSRIGSKFDRGLEVMGGLVLMGIGLKILISHLLGIGMG